MIYVDPLLLWTLTTEASCSINDIIANLHAYSEQCQKCPPNITRGLRGSLGFKCWVLRGFYPNTNTMFKMTISKPGGNGDAYIKVTLPDARKCSGMRVFNKQQIKAISNGILLNDTVKEKKVSMPKCMTPKGMKPLKWNKV